MVKIKSPSVISVFLFWIVVIGRLLTVSECYAQLPGIPPLPSADSQSSLLSPEQETQRKQLWQSDEMLEVRAWLEDHFRRSAQISEEQGKKFLMELEALPPDQMKIWLNNFNRERDQRVQGWQSWRQANRAKVELQSASPQVGGFRNPYRRRGSGSTNVPGTGRQPSNSRQSPSIAPVQRVEKPFSSPHYQNSVRPLITSEDAARVEILRGLAPWGL